MRTRNTILGFLSILFGFWIIFYEPVALKQIGFFPDADPIGIGGVGFITLGLIVVYLELTNKGAEPSAKPAKRSRNAK